MDNMCVFSLKTIRCRSLIAEALLDMLPACSDKKRYEEIIMVCRRSADVVEHIAQYALDGCLEKYQLIQDLESALFILDVFNVELSSTKLSVPHNEEIKALMAEIGGVK